jgi:transcriptional regulator GlxA family with amidase domain
MCGRIPRKCLAGLFGGTGRETKELGMSRQLMEITDWPERAAAAQWCVNSLAVACCVSLPQLERHFQQTWRKSPRAWLQAERMRRACELLERRERIKDIAGVLYYWHPRNFSRAFTKHFGYSPHEHLPQKSRVKGES